MMMMMMMMWGGASGSAHHVCFALPYGSHHRLRPATRRTGFALKTRTHVQIKKKKHSWEFVQRVRQRGFLSSPPGRIGRCESAEKKEDGVGKYGRWAHPTNNRLKPREIGGFLVRGTPKAEHQNARVRPNKGDLRRHRVCAQKGNNATAARSRICTPKSQLRVFIKAPHDPDKEATRALR